MKDEQTEDDVQYFVTCTYCGTQTQLSLGQIEGDRPLKCATCGAPFKVIPPPKKPPEPPVKKRKKPFDDYDAILDERQAYEMRTGGEFKKTGYVVGIIVGALITTIYILLMIVDSCR